MGSASPWRWRDAGDGFVKNIADFFFWITTSAVLAWVSGMIFAGDPCTRAVRAAWPVTYFVRATQYLPPRWVAADTHASLYAWKVRSELKTQQFFDSRCMAHRKNKSKA